MSTRQLVVAGESEFFVELTALGGPTTISATDALSFEGVRSAIEGIAGELAKAWEKARPDEATVDFGLKLTTKSGRLTGLIVEGGGEASLTVSLKWTSGTPEA